MTEFCPYCGKTLAEGEICSCINDSIDIKQEVSEDVTLKTDSNSPAQSESIIDCEKTAVSTEESTSRFTPENPSCKYTTKLAKLVICFFKHPLSILLNNYKHISFSTSIVLISIKALTAAIFFLILIGRLIDGYSKLIPYIDRIFGLGGFFRYWGSSIRVPYVEIFIKVIILTFILFFILAGLFYIACMLFGKKESSFTRVISVLSITSIASSAAFIIASLFLLFIPSFAAYILLFGFIFHLILIHFGICDVFDICPDTGIYSTSLVYLGFFLVLSLFTIQAL